MARNNIIRELARSRMLKFKKNMSKVNWTALITWTIIFYISYKIWSFILS